MSREGKVGYMFSSGEIVHTKTGRDTTCFPLCKYDTPQKAHNTIKRINSWLYDNAKFEAEARRDSCALLLFSSMNVKNLKKSEKDVIESYLFHE